jgi:hypothetical protein
MQRALPLLLIVVVAALALPVATHASLKVTWPEQRTYAAGEELTVKVASDKAVPVALVRQSASGKVMRTIARRTLRKGTFTAAVPAAGRYSLRVAQRGRTVTVVEPVAWPQASPTPPPTFPTLPAPPTACVTATDMSAELRLSATTVQAGGTLPYTLVNTSAACAVTAGAPYEFEWRLTDGTWEAVQSKQVFATYAVFLPAGRTYAKQAQIPADFRPGSYRLLDSVSGGSGVVHVAAEFEVTA